MKHLNYVIYIYTHTQVNHSYFIISCFTDNEISMIYIHAYINIYIYILKSQGCMLSEKSKSFAVLNLEIDFKLSPNLIHFPQMLSAEKKGRKGKLEA